MKKLFAFALAAMMLATMSVTAFAADVTTTGNASADLTVKYSAGSTVDAYAATIEWGSMEFTYTAAAQKWDTDDLQWVNDGTAAWSAGSAEGAGTVKITNRSSKDINAKFAWNAATGAMGVTGIAVNGSAIVADGYTIPTADAASSDTAHIKSFTILPTGDYTSTDTTAVTVGSITITLV